MQKTYVAILFLTTFWNALVAQENSVKICFDENCAVAVDGKSNISPYSCRMVELPVSEQPIPFTSSYSNGRLLMNNAKVSLATSGFHCSNAAMTADFLKALKADKFPFITIYFSQLYIPTAPQRGKNYQNVNADISFTIAGVKRKYSVVFSNVDFTNDQMQINGTVKLKMSEFNIDPPQALFGLVKAEDNIAVNFSLKFCVN